MRALPFLLAAAVAAWPGSLAARETVEASAPEKLAVTVYRDPERGEDGEMDPDWPRGFAMISETRQVTLPPGESTIRFTGVAEGMVAVTAIVTGLPGGTIEKNRNADLLSPGALVDGTLGNRVRITRTNPATGRESSEQAIVRTRADGGLVLQTAAGFEAVRCSGLPERLTFDRVPAGLSAEPVFSIDTRSDAGGTHTVTLTYLAWGFDWQASYVGRLDEGREGSKARLQLLSWLTLVNDNGQSFADAELMAVAGRLNVTSDYEGLADPPVARPLQLVCYPFGSTARGTDLPPPPPPPAAPVQMEFDGELASITVTGSRMMDKAMESPTPIMAVEEALGDLKLYRVPVPVTVAAMGMKQVAFLQKDKVEAEFLYRFQCDPYARYDTIEPESDLVGAQILLVTKNVEGKGLGAALPMGNMTLFEPGEAGEQLVAEVTLRDYAVGQDVELELGESSQVLAQCANTGKGNPDENGRKWTRMRAVLSNANPAPVTVRLALGWSSEWDVRWPQGQTRVKDGQRVAEVTIPANSNRHFDWRIRRAASNDVD